MANSTKPLTNTEVKQAKSKAKEYNLADGGGLYLRVKPNGTKLWLYNYFKPFTKKRSNISLGQYPKVTLGKARDLKQDYQSLLIQNIDPRDSRIEQEALGKQAHDNTFEVVYRKWLNTKEGVWSDSYRTRLTNAIELHILPTLGKLPIHKLNAPDTIKFLEPLAERRALETVRKLCRWINEVMVFATNTGLVDANRLSGIGKAFQAPKVINRPTIKPEELPKFLKDLEQAGNDITVKCQILWLLNTLVRPGEGAGTRWEEIDLENKLWEIPAERMKKRRPHIVPLTDQMLSLLEIMKPISQHREFVFPSRNHPREPINKESANMAIKRMGYKGKLVAHGLRSLASTTLNEQEFPHDVIEAALAHVDPNAIRGIYNRAEYIEQRRVMLQWWSDHIEQDATGINPAEGKKHLKVVQV
ncbi:MAG: tyrosine-type recombinase/integrase [Proteobacteria bacterium]|nr:tyrosine-type recombinase/integrase [Pseudomonadota bacterium]